MNELRANIQKELDRLWPKAKKNMARINKDVAKLLKKSEENVVHLSKSVKKNVEKVILKARREELYYELGSALAPSLTSDQLKNPKVLKIHTQIQQLNKSLRSKKA